MRTLDRYVVKTFLMTAWWFFVVFMLLRVVVDLFVNMDEFAEGDHAFWTMAAHITSYYAHQLLAFFTELGGVVIVAAATFSLAMMNHTNELTAMLASGVSLRRVTVPIIISSVLLGGLILVDQELILPKVADKLVRQQDDVEGTKSFMVKLVNDGMGNVWYSRLFEPAKESMAEPLVIVRNEGLEAVARVSGTQAHPTEGGWAIQGGSLNRIASENQVWREIPSTRRVGTASGPLRILQQVVASQKTQTGQELKPEDITAVKSVAIEDPAYGLKISAAELTPARSGDSWMGTLARPQFAFHDDAGRLIGTFRADSASWDGAGWTLTNGVLVVRSDLTTEDLVLRQSSRWMQYMSIRDLLRLLEMKRISDPAAAVLTIHTRVLDPLNNLVMLLLALPFILSRERNIKASATLCLVTVGLFYAFVYLVRNIGLPPIWAASLPVLIFGPLSVVMFDSVKT